MTDAIQLVCLDVGGVVVRICRTWAEGCAAAGIASRNPSLWEETAPGRKALIQQYQTGRIDGATFAEQISVLVSGVYSPSEVMGVHHAWLLDEYEGVGDVVERVHRAGLETAALSNTSHEHWCRMGEFPAVMRIRHHLPSHRLGLQKPDPKIYERLEQQLGYNGGQIIFFDDKIENVEGARAAGWHGEIIDPAASPAAQIAEALRAHGVAV
ncbi:MAG: HAD-IA family hydrolase [Planctomycetota bacterium]|jgi:putative hydrolase of the HAD superfamily